MLHLKVSLAANQLVSRGRYLARLLRHVNATEYRGHPPQSLLCTRIEIVRSLNPQGPGHLRDYLIELIEVDPDGTRDARQQDFAAILADAIELQDHPFRERLPAVPLTPQPTPALSPADA